MKKRLDIGWGVNEYNDEILNKENNNWFFVSCFNIDNEDTIEKLSSDPRIINNKKLDVFIIHKNNIKEILCEYKIKYEIAAGYFDSCYGDWQQDYSNIGKNFNIDEHEAYKIVGNYITEVIEEMHYKINSLSKEDMYNLSEESFTELEYKFFAKYFHKDLMEKVKFLEDYYSEYLK